MYGNSMMLLLDAIMLKANTAPNYFFSVLCVSMVAMPTGYKLVISRALGMHGIYCPQPSGALCPRASMQ